MVLSSNGRCAMKRIVVRKPGTAKLTGTASVIHKG